MKGSQRMTVDTGAGERPVVVTVEGIKHALHVDEAARLRDDLHTALCELTIDHTEVGSTARDYCVTPTGRTDRHGQYVCSVNGVLCCEFCKEPL